MLDRYRIEQGLWMQPKGIGKIALVKLNQKDILLSLSFHTNEIKTTQYIAFGSVFFVLFLVVCNFVWFHYVCSILSVFFFCFFAFLNAFIWTNDKYKARCFCSVILRCLYWHTKRKLFLESKSVQQFCVFFGYVPNVWMV